MKYETESGSVYEVDEAEGKARLATPPKRTSAHFIGGGWVSFEAFGIIECRLEFAWSDGTKTVTSKIKDGGACEKNV